MSDWSTLMEKTIRDDLDWIMLNENSGGVTKKMRIYNFLIGLGGEVSPSPYILLRDKKATGTPGGSFLAGTRRVRDLTEELIDTDNICTLSSNQFTLPAGIYRFFASCPAYQVNRHQAFLRNVSDAIDLICGTGEYAYSFVSNRSFLSGYFTISSETLFEIQHQCEADRLDVGFGVSAAFGDAEIYTIVEIWKEG